VYPVPHRRGTPRRRLYANPGHIPGAYNYEPASNPFTTPALLTTLPTNRPVVIYCFTGQTSSYLAGYLRMLGYDAKSLSTARTA
jgi:rhodanese-related sulfurtransferase